MKQSLHPSRGRRLRLEPLEERAMLSVAVDADSRFVTNVYADVLDRLPGDAELGFWRDRRAQGAPLDAMVGGFLTSTEFRQNLVTELYFDFLGRGTDVGGLNFWVDLLGKGVSERLLLAGILNSPEYFDRQGGTNDDFVRGLYRDVLGRQQPPGPEEVAFYDNLLRQGVAPGAIALGFINSPEFIGVRVNEWFLDFLNREADPGGMQFYVDFFNGGGSERSIQFALLASSEYVDRVLADFAPADILTIRAAEYDPTGELSVRFFDDDGLVVDVPVAAATRTSVKVAIPPLIDPLSEELAAGALHAQVIQDGTPLPTAIVASLKIDEAPSSPFAAGVVTTAFLGGLDQAIDDLLVNITGTTFDTAATRTALAAQQVDAAALRAALQTVVADPTQTAVVPGTFAGGPIILDADDLAISDRVILALFDQLRGDAAALAGPPLAPAPPPPPPVFPPPGGRPFMPTSQLLTTEHAVAAASVNGDCGAGRAAAARENPTANNFHSYFLGRDPSSCGSEQFLEDVHTAFTAMSGVTLGFGLGILAAAPLLPPATLMLFGGGVILLGYAAYEGQGLTAEDIQQIQAQVDNATRWAQSNVNQLSALTTGLFNDLLATFDALFTEFQAAGPPAQILVSPTALTTSEALRDQRSFEVRLTKRPTAPVQVVINHANDDEGDVSRSLLLFDENNWVFPQQVQVTGVDEFIDDGDQTYVIELAPAISADPRYNGLDPANVSVTNVDNDQAGVIIGPLNGLETDENGRFAHFTVRLASQPTAPVTFFVSSSRRDEGLVLPIDPVEVTFHPNDWNVTRTIPIVGVDDAVVDGHQTYQIITTRTGSADPAYNNLDVPDITVVNHDNDVALPPAPAAGVWTGTATQVDAICSYAGAMTISLAPLVGLPGNFSGQISLNLNRTGGSSSCTPTRTGTSNVVAVQEGANTLRFFIPGIFFSGEGTVNGPRWNGNLRIISGGVVTTGVFNLVKQ